MARIEKCPLGGKCDFNEGEIIRFAVHQPPLDEVFGKNGEDVKEMEECFPFCDELRKRVSDVMKLLAECTNIDPTKIDAIQNDAEMVRMRNWIYKKESQPDELRISA